MWVHPILPMEPLPLNNITGNDAAFIYQVKWDGVRMMAYVWNNQIKLLNKQLNLRCRQYPELHSLPQKIKAASFILDGEIIVLNKGKPSFPSVMRRDLAQHNHTIKQLVSELPVSYMVFDLLYCNEKNLTLLSYAERKNMLSTLLEPDDHLYLVEDFADGQGLLAATRSNKLEGIVAKRTASSYHPGKKHRDWFKTKHRLTDNFVVGGYTTSGKRINSLLLGIYQKEKLIYVGKASTGLNQSTWDLLNSELPHMRVTSPPFVDFPVSVKASLFFIHPYLTVQVEYAEWTEKAQLRSPVIKGFIADDPHTCII